MSTTTKKTLSQKLIEFHMEVGKVRKTGTNPHFRSKYADINAVLDVIMPVLTSKAILLVQSPNITESGHVLVTKLINADDSSDLLESVTPLILPKHDMQAYGSAVTYARRYALMCMLDLEAEDDDANRASQYQQNNNQQPQANSQYGSNQYGSNQYGSNQYAQQSRG